MKNNRKILLIHDKEDNELKDLISITLNRSNLSDLLFSSIELDIDIQQFYDLKNMSESKIDKSLSGKISSAVSEADVIIIIVSNRLVVNPELNDAMNNKSEELESKYLINFMYRPSDTEGSKWIEYGIVMPGLNYPFETQTENRKGKIISELITGISNWLKTADRKIEKIFMSYSHADSVFVDILKLRLQEKGFKVSIDTDITIGQKWKLEIDNMIKEASFILLILSQKSKTSDYVTYEWAYAMASKKIIIPVVIDDLDMSKLHPKLSDLQAISFNDRQTRNLDNLISIIEKTYYRYV